MTQRTPTALVHVCDCPWPIRSGYHVRVWQVINSLQALGLRVDLFASSGPIPNRSRWTDTAKDYCKSRDLRLHLVPYTFGTIDFWLNAAWTLYARKLAGRTLDRPSGPQAYRPRLQARWRQLLRSRQFDVTVTNYAQWFRLNRISHECGIPTIVDLHDLFASHVQPQNGSEYAAFLQDEVRSLRHADRVLSINSEETRALKPWLGTKVLDLPSCLVEPRRFLTERVESDLLIVGTDIPFNRAGVSAFLSGSWRHLANEFDRLSLIVCGTIANAVPELPGVLKLADPIPDLSPYYQGTKVVVAASVGSVGTKIKMIEAMANGCCIVAHRDCVRGLSFEDGVHGIIVDDFAQAHQRISDLLRDPDRQKAYGTQALDLFRSNHNAPRSIEIVQGVLQGLGIRPAMTSHSDSRSDLLNPSPIRNGGLG